MAATTIESAEFLDLFRDRFRGVLRWHELDSLWSTLRTQSRKSWFIYAVGSAPPIHSASAAELDRFLTKIDSLLRKEHDEDYCGVVYADSFDDPEFIKIFDPNNLGVSCGFSDNPPLPGWVLSTTAPIDLPMATAPTASRRRWWNKIFS
ncbi:MAG TPA: hypothetical protein EYN73_04520 [Chromatiaceae bacterium]|nr:hypothetical protein [Chromatiaceae bacterium]HIN81634.1 hypothetical protein [Chromatiales bacterium]